MEGDNVAQLPMRVPTELETEMCARIKAVIYEYTGQVSFVSALGVIEVVKHELLQNAE